MTRDYLSHHSHSACPISASRRRRRGIPSDHRPPAFLMRVPRMLPSTHRTTSRPSSGRHLSEDARNAQKVLRALGELSKPIMERIGRGVHELRSPPSSYLQQMIRREMTKKTSCVHCAREADVAYRQVDAHSPRDVLAIFAIDKGSRTAHVRLERLV